MCKSVVSPEAIRPPFPQWRHCLSG